MNPLPGNNPSPKVPRIPQRKGELAWIEARIEQLEEILDIPFYDTVRIIGSSHLIQKLQALYMEDVLFRRRWKGTEFIFLPIYWKVEGDDAHWYYTQLLSAGMEELDFHGLAYETPMPQSHIEIRWTLWGDGISPVEAEGAARRLSLE